jgi:hypothetical protein
MAAMPLYIESRLHSKNGSMDIRAAFVDSRDHPALISSSPLRVRDRASLSHKYATYLRVYYGKDFANRRQKHRCPGASQTFSFGEPQVYKARKGQETHFAG